MMTRLSVAAFAALCVVACSSPAPPEDSHGSAGPGAAAPPAGSANDASGGSSSTTPFLGSTGDGDAGRAATCATDADCGAGAHCVANENGSGEFQTKSCVPLPPPPPPPACFHSGQWDIANVVPCFVNGNGATYAVSTSVVNGQPQCPSVSMLPPPTPTAPWSDNSVTTDCAGQFTLCFEVKAGNPSAALASDCAIAKVCTAATIGAANVMQTLPALPAWSSAESACIAKFQATGGYGEMTVSGKSANGEVVAEPDQPKVFGRVSYCTPACKAAPGSPGCPTTCGFQAGGSF